MTAFYRCKNLLLPGLLCATLFLSACRGTPTAEPEPEPAPPALHSQPMERALSPHLTQGYAAMRAGQISQVDYRLSVVLDNTGKRFSGEVEIDFSLAENNAADITVDFNGGEVLEIALDDQPVEWDYNDWFITLPADAVSPGAHTLSISYTRPYATDGDGLHRYQDAETGNVYLYTNFEPYNANKLLPHFDQPNLKASYTLDVVAPASWQVITATREAEVTALEGDKKHWLFPPSDRISSYIFPLHAGPYHVWESSYRDQQGEIPLRLFARQEIAEYVKTEDWFTATRQSFGFFNDYFELRYPFGKYDQVIVPDFNAGAMENLAAVTFTERFVSRGEKTEAQRIRLANVIAHEMAHMWFGNLVTMNWWNGLWLNESFATYMANLQLARASDFENTWDIFYSRTKQWAYETDQQVTTHPIELPVPTTADAFTNFDGITYGKGASVLKQLPYFLGEENFRRGVANYLREHAYSNTELTDFTGALGEAAKMDLTEWTEEWLYRAGLNTLEADFSCEDGQLDTLSLRQSAPLDHPTLRSQRTQLGLYRADREAGAELISRMPVTYSGALTPVEVDAETDCPDLVYPNLEDWGYVKISLDPRSRETVMANIHQFENDSLRIMLWQSLWNSVRDHRLPLTEFVNFALKNLASENNDRILAQVSSQLAEADHYLWLNDDSGSDYAPQRQAIADFFWQQLQTAQPGSDQQKIWFDYWASVIESSTQLQRAEKLLGGQLTVDGLNLDQDRRWSLVLRLNQFAHGDYRQHTRRQAQADSSDRGQSQALAAEAIRPDGDIKKLWLGRIAAVDGQYRLAQLTSVMNALFPASQVQLRREFSGVLFDLMPELARKKDERFMNRFSRALLPATCDQESINRMRHAIDQHAGLSPTLDKALKIANQENERCLAIGQLLGR